MTAPLCIIQARMESTRFPGKVLAPLKGVPMLLRLLSAAYQGTLDTGATIVVATTNRDEPIEAYVRQLRLPVAHFRPAIGTDPADVLGRYAQCARAFPGTGPVVRLTGDCPLHSADVIRRTLEQFHAPAQYLFSHWLWDLPKGREVEVFTRDLLERADREAMDPADREHVTPWMRQLVGLRPERYTEINLSVDTLEDLRRADAWLSKST